MVNPLRDNIRHYGLRARPALGQNFILDFNLLTKIARAVELCKTDTVLEVGAGPGGLTRALLEEGATRVIAVEQDERFIPLLEKIPGLTILHADARTLSLEHLKPTKIVGNLPFNIATTLIASWLSSETWPPCFQSITVTVQKEVAARILSPHNSRRYGRLSVLCQWRTRPKKLFDIPQEAFVPMPQVAGTVLQFEVRKKPIVCDRHVLQHVVAAAFGQRRKTLRTSLSTLTKDKNTAVLIAQKARVDPGRRAEQCSVEDFCALARAFRDL